MKPLVVLLLVAAHTLAHPPQAAPPVTLPPLQVPARAAFPQTAERLSYPERPGRQLFVDDPVVEDVFIQTRVRQRTTRLPTVYETVEETPAAMPMSYAPLYAAPRVYADYTVLTPRYTYAAPAYVPRYAPVYEPAGAYTKARYGPFGKLREVETTGDPARVPRSTPGPVRTLLFGGN